MLFRSPVVRQVRADARDALRDALRPPPDGDDLGDLAVESDLVALAGVDVIEEDFAGGVFAFIVSFDQFPVSLFLVQPKNETLPVVLFNYMKFDLDGAIAAASMVSILLAVAVVLVLEKLIGLKAYVKL